jgi:hypothetical protein
MHYDEKIRVSTVFFDPDLLTFFSSIIQSKINSSVSENLELLLFRGFRCLLILVIRLYANMLKLSYTAMSSDMSLDQTLIRRPKIVRTPITLCTKTGIKQPFDLNKTYYLC